MSLSKISSLSKKNLGKEISVAGWVENIRDHGGVIFIDLREGNEILQVVVEPQNKEIFEVAESIRDEFVISVSGEIRERPKGTINKKMTTGEIELDSSNLSIFVPVANTLPPSSINFFTSAFPIPPVPPVINIVLLLNII